jgi:hypothetical protein
MSGLLLTGVLAAWSVVVPELTLSGLLELLDAVAV